MSKENAVFWNVSPCGSCKNRHFRGTYHLRYQGGKNLRARNVSSETWVVTKPHGITSQKKTLFIVTAVKTSNLTSHFKVCIAHLAEYTPFKFSNLTLNMELVYDLETSATSFTITWLYNQRTERTSIMNHCERRTPDTGHRTPGFFPV
jgi:hypothetical protein